MTRTARFIQYAYNASHETPSSCIYPIGAAIALGSRLISVANCTKKTHPKNPKIKEKTLKSQLCAEVLAALRAENIISAGQMKNCSIYVTRRRADGSMGMAMPCKYCQTFLKKMGIKRIFYTNQRGRIKEMKIGMGKISNRHL